MDPADRAIIRYVTDELRRVQENGSPYGVWVRRYAPIPANFSGDDGIQAAFLSAWFVEPEGSIREDSCSYRRFQVMQQDQPWRSRASGESPPSPLSSHHSIALAAFAAYEGSDEFYLETIWGGTWARGVRVQIIDGQVIPTHSLWLS